MEQQPPARQPPQVLDRYAITTPWRRAALYCTAAGVTVASVALLSYRLVTAFPGTGLGDASGWPAALSLAALASLALWYLCFRWRDPGVSAAPTAASPAAMAKRAQHPRLRQHRATWVVAAAVMGLSALTLAMVLLALRDMRTQQLKAGQNSAMSLALVSEEVMARTLQLLDAQLVELERTWAGGRAAPTGTRDPMNPALSEAADRLSFVRAIWILDATGRMVHDSDSGNLGLDLSDRDYFRAHRERVIPGVFIGNAILSRTTGTWFVSVSRALRSPDGAFLGVLVAALEHSHFVARWQELDLGLNGSISVFSADGRLLIRMPSTDSLLGESFAGDTLFTTPLPPTGRTEVRATDIDHVSRVFAARPVGDYPQLVMAVGRSTAEVLQAWRRFSAMALAGWAIGSSLLCAMGILLLLELRRRQHTEQELRESEAQRLFSLEAAGVGDWSMDLRTNVATRSFRHDRCFGYGAPVAQWGYDTFLAHVHPADRERVNQVFQAAMAGDGEYDVEFRVIWPDGSTHWLWSKGRFMQDIDGRACSVAGIQVDITHRRLESEALHHITSRYVSLFRNSLEGILQVGAEGQILSANPAACALFGFQDENAVHDRQRVGVTGIETTLQRLLDMRNADGAAAGEITLRRADGSSFVADVSAVFDQTDGSSLAGSVFVRDVTERNQAARRAAQQIARLDLLREVTRGVAQRQGLTELFDAASGLLLTRMPAALTGVMLVQADRLAVRVDSVAAAPNGPAAALSVGMVLPANANGLARCLRAELVHEPDLSALDFDLPRRLAAAGLRSAVLAPLALDGRVFGLMLVARSEAGAFSSGDCEFLHQLSEHVALAAHQARLYEDLQHAYERLQHSQQLVLQQERLRALGQMASGVAHDINNAVSPVALYTESLLDTEPGLSERTRRYLHTIQRAIDDVIHTVARMREFSRERDSGAGLQSVQFNALVPQVLELTRARWRDMPQQAGIVIDVASTLAPGLPTVLATEGEIREALTNLVFNAVDAMPKGGRLRLDTALQMGPDGQHEAALLVSDSGVGMDETTRRRCLEPFYTTKGERGTGLGLAMVYGTVQRHGGRIEIDSTPGQGTTVRLLFPVQSPAPVPALPAVPPPAPALQVLLVDDDALLLDSLGEILRGEGHQVQTAQGGQAGIEAMRQAVQAGQRVDVVITDLGMPHIDGTQVACAAKDLLPATTVVMLTGWGSRMSEEQEQPAHVDLVLSKPPRLAQLRDMARHVAQGMTAARVRS